MDLKEEKILGDKIYTHWYYISKGYALRKFLGKFEHDVLLDVGAGSGIFSRQLLEADLVKQAYCIDPGYAAETEETHAGKPLKFLKQHNGPKASLALMMDVLEHVDDDVALLQEYIPHLEQGGQIAITVPAFNFLWSGHDIFLEHRRRYTIKMLEKAVEDAGLEVVKSRYFFGLLFPLVCIIRFIKKLLLKGGALEAKSEMSIAPSWLNTLLTFIHKLEAHAIFSINKAAGLSVFCLCRKK